MGNHAAYVLSDSIAYERIVTSVASICHISVLFSHIDIRQKLRADLSLRFTIHDTAVCLVDRKDKHLGNLYVCRG